MGLPVRGSESLKFNGTGRYARLRQHCDHV